MSYEKDNEVHIEDDDARAASTPGIVRYVLAISLILAVIAMTMVWVVPAIWG
ncbi:hypothetical protein [Erythrobacter sp. THAF29]|uniref:hypothetical protein n=1 Tax=Erythrobacter sp. THAF29 TaxID=2587851 RepID=UPI0012A7D7A3|nr:hypothetical protein [Erythrobacter sp. THAF29]QFT78782.1 hypothetical protein FIU90_14625 [Erythrobacter sp. THAF29]